MKGPRPKDREGRDLVLLKDLVPRRDPMGGSSGKPVFGESSVVPRTGASGSVRKGTGKKK